MHRVMLFWEVCCAYKQQQNLKTGMQISCILSIMHVATCIVNHLKVCFSRLWLIRAAVDIAQSTTASISMFHMQCG